MDTTKTELPFSKARYGTTQKAWHLGVHMVGVLIHGRHPICFLDYHQFPHDSNLMINTLLQVSYHMVFYPFVLVLHKERSHFYIKYFTLRRAFFVIQKSASFLIPKNYQVGPLLNSLYSPSVFRNNLLMCSTSIILKVAIFLEFDHRARGSERNHQKRIK